MKKIVLTGGGTAGHVTPHIALLPLLQSNDFTIHYIGTRNGIERELLAKEKVVFHCITAGKLRRYADIRNITDLFRIALGFVQSICILFRVMPDVVFSKGGFVSCPVVWASWLLRIPVIIHESDITPGLANRLSIPFASKVCYSFQETGPKIQGGKSVYTGLPVRQSLLSGDADKGRGLCNFTNNKPVILVIGGSQGALAINTVLREALDLLLERFNICHICGKGGTRPIERNGYVQFEYVNQPLADLFAVADICISRSGATALFEILALRKPGLLIPLPLSASRGDQILNARSFESRGWSMVLLQENLTPQTLVTHVNQAFDNRAKMIDAMKSSPASNGLENVMNIILQYGKNS
jgi:UDP-N-acetylglucosamine--N-acetylmuramyl-(pentapeptide) pyrophosphoryl-undecaprenol N-acetylglucosamine transferase